MEASILLTVTILVLSLFGHLRLRFSQPGHLFGVAVPSDFSNTESARRTTAIYRAGVWSSAAASIVILWASHRLMISFVIYVLAIYVSLIIANRRIKKSKDEATPGLVRQPLKVEPKEDVGGTSDEGWNGGILYFNRADPSLWVQKRTGFGWTLNFANPWSWILLVAISLAALVLHFSLVRR